MDLSRFKDLLKRYTEGRLSAEEAGDLQKAVAGGQFDGLIEENILQRLREMKAHEDWTIERQTASWQNILENRAARDQSKRFRPLWLKWAAAAAVTGLLATGAWWVMKPQEQEPVAIAMSQPDKRDFAPPDGIHAVITLANGQQIILDSTGTGTIATQGNVQLVKLADGQIAYSGLSGEVVYNTLSNPRGSRVINLTLSDGTRIWLNSESSLRYPTAFAGKERNVEITGEAYFEVAKDPSKKFIVSSAGIKTEVLGTHFNVNAYNNESATRVTLLEGSVKVTELTTQNEKLIKPGQQVQLNDNNKFQTNNQVDMEEVMAWKNGKFQFGEATDIATIMRQIERWYNVEVEYRRAPSGHIGGTISRNVPVSQVFEILEMTGSIKFKIEGKKIIVM